MHKSKVRCTSANSPKIYSCTVIFFDITEFFPDTTFFTIRKLALRGNKVKIYRAINQSNSIIDTFDLRQTLPKYIRTILNKFEALINLDNGTIIFTYYPGSEISTSTIQHIKTSMLYFADDSHCNFHLYTKGIFFAKILYI